MWAAASTERALKEVKSTRPGGGRHACAVPEVEGEGAVGQGSLDVGAAQMLGACHSEPSRPAAFAAWRAGLILTTSHTRPSRSSARMTARTGRAPAPQAVAAEVGNA